MVLFCMEYNLNSMNPRILNLFQMLFFLYVNNKTTDFLSYRHVG